MSVTTFSGNSYTSLHNFLYRTITKTNSQMKQILLILAMMLCVVSCEKEGEPTPDQTQTQVQAQVQDNVPSVYTVPTSESESERPTDFTRSVLHNSNETSVQYTDFCGDVRYSFVHTDTVDASYHIVVNQTEDTVSITHIGITKKFAVFSYRDDVSQTLPCSDIEEWEVSYRFKDLETEQEQGGITYKYQGNTFVHLHVDWISNLDPWNRIQVYDLLE